MLSGLAEIYERSRIMKKFLCLCGVFVVLMAACPQLFAQHVIEGRVVDRDNQPIAFVTVQSTGFVQTVQTDDKGRFKASTSHEEEISVTFSHAGYIPRTLRLTPVPASVEVIMTEQVYPMQGITVTAGQAVPGRSPISYQDISRDQIETYFNIGEVPEFLELTPNVYSYSDAGGGLGYSYILMRGFDARRTPVYINSVPLNDPEDHALYFVDLPDFVDNADHIQVQRGVGNAMYGEPSFGGAINILTGALSLTQKFEAEFGYGGLLYDGDKTAGILRRSSVLYQSGLINDAWSLSGRVVKQYSGGYRKNSWYNGTAYYLTVGRIDPRSITWIDIYGGPMRTHAAWWGITRPEIHSDRRFNYYTYADEADNFTQPHFELHNIYNLTDDITINSTAYLIKGDGYYEEYRYGEWLIDYNLTDDSAIYSDLIRRKWVDKYQIGLNNHTTLEGNKHTSTFGASYYFFESEHWGEAIWAQALDPSIKTDDPARYYEYFGKYHNFSVFGSRTQSLGDRLALTGNLQLRYLHKDIHMTALGIYPTMIYSLDWLFLSPRFGINYALTDNLTPYIGFSVASHEPNDDMIDDSDDPSDEPRLQVIDSTTTPIVYGDPLIDPERVYDLEVGTNYRTDKISVDINLFWMEYRNELVPDGGVNSDGFPTQGNARRSVHRGVELSFAIKALANLTVEGNYAFNDNWIREYDQLLSNAGGIDTVQRRDVYRPQYPKYLANLSLKYNYRWAGFVYRLRAAGRQFPYFDGQYAWFESEGKFVDVSIAPFVLHSIKGIFDLGEVLGAGLTVEGRVDNLFDHQYESYGAYSYGDYYYWPAAERNWFINLKLTI